MGNDWAVGFRRAIDTLNPMLGRFNNIPVRLKAYTCTGAVRGLRSLRPASDRLAVPLGAFQSHSQTLILPFLIMGFICPRKSIHSLSLFFTERSTMPRPKSLSALYVELRNIRDFKTSAEELKL